MQLSPIEQIVVKRSEGMRFGTERTRALLNALGSPDDNLKIIHVAGTNGKGSVCIYLTHILLAAGKRVGTYMTPEVYSFEEQFLIDGVPSRRCAHYISLAGRAAEELADKPTAYEIQTAAAFLMFAEEGCEYAVIECCMGGLLDTTNAVRKKILAVITSISLEHTAWLGERLERIARHKAGIIKDCPAVISQCVPEEVRGIFFSLGAALSMPPEYIEEGKESTTFFCGGKKYTTKMLGCKQPYNAAAAITAAKELGINADAVAAGVRRAEFAGRLQVICSRGREYILDGAHNPESMVPLAQFLKKRYSSMRRIVVYGCLRDKDIEAVLQKLEGCAEEVIAVRPNSYRAMEFDKILSACEAAFPLVQGAGSIAEALESADGGVVAVCGSFTILKEAREWIERGL